MSDNGDAHHREPVKPLLITARVELAERLTAYLDEGGLPAHVQRIQSLAELEVALTDGRWDIILTDFHLPEFNALDLLDRLRRLDAELPVIVVSDINGEELAVAAMHAGARDYIMQDNLTRLIPAIEREIHEAALHRERRNAQRALVESERRFRQLTDNIHDVFWLVDCTERRMVYVSPAYAAVWERNADPLFSSLDALLDTVHPEDHERMVSALRETPCGALNDEYRIVLPDDGERWVATRSFPIHDAAGQLTRVAGLSTDITARKRLEQETNTLGRALEQSADVVMITGANSLIEYVNPAFEEVTGYAREEVMGMSPNLLKSGFQDQQFYNNVWKTLQHGLPYTDIFINRRKNGELYYEAKTITPIRDAQGAITHYVSTGKDITGRLKVQERMQRLMHYDAVSGLANSALFNERVSQSFSRASRRHLPFGVLVVGMELSNLLTGLKRRNQGERLLRLVAERLRETVAEEGSVARLDDNEFAVLVDAEVTREALETLAARLLNAFAHPISNDGYELFITPYVGISVYPDDADRPDLLIEHARAALTEGREDGTERRYRFFEAGALSRRRLSS